MKSVKEILVSLTDEATAEFILIAIAQAMNDQEIYHDGRRILLYFQGNNTVISDFFSF
jgi:hypothetical protein